MISIQLVGEESACHIHWPHRADWANTAAGATASRNEKVLVCMMVVDLQASLGVEVDNTTRDCQCSRDALSLISFVSRSAFRIPIEKYAGVSPFCRCQHLGVTAPITNRADCNGVHQHHSPRTWVPLISRLQQVRALARRRVSHDTWWRVISRCLQRGGNPGKHSALCS